MAAIRTRLDPIDRDIAALIDADLLPEAQSRALAAFAREALEEGQAQNAHVLGRIPPHDTHVDGAATDNLDQVRPDGRILFEFRLLDDVLVWISEQLVRRSPVKTGRFAASFALFADGVEVDIVSPPAAAQEFVFLNLQPYARKVERGQSPQAPDGIFEGIASVAQRRFGNTARIGFGWRSPRFSAGAGGRGRKDRASERQLRTPAIFVRPR